MLVALVQVLVGLQFENLSRHLNSNRLDERRNLLTFFLGEAESFIRLAIQASGDSLLPFAVESFKDLWRDRQLGSTRVNDRGVRLICAIQWLASIVNLLSFKSPCSKEVRIAWE